MAIGTTKAFSAAFLKERAPKTKQTEAPNNKALVTHENISSADAQAFQTIALGLIGQFDTLKIINFFGNTPVELEDTSAGELQDFETAIFQNNTYMALEIVSKNCNGINPESLNLFNTNIPEA